MKKLLLIAFFSSAVIFPFHSHCCADRRPMNTADKVVLSVVAAGLGVAGIYYISEQFPSRRYASAQKTYKALDECVTNFDVANDEVTEAVTKRHPLSPYPLVATFNYINSLYQEAQNAIQKLENAVWWSNEEAFVLSCNTLKAQIKVRMPVLAKVNNVLRSNPLWAQQYGLYLQQCQNDEMRKLRDQVAINGLNNSLSHIHHCHSCC